MDQAPQTTGAPTVQRLLARTFQRYRDRPCVRWEGGSATYGETFQRVAGVSAWLDSVAGGTRHVAILLPNGREYVEAILACALGGVVRVPMSPRDPLDVIRVKLVESDCRVLITTAALAGELAEWVRDSGATLLVVDDPHPGGQDPSYADLLHNRLTPSFAAREGDRYRLSFTGGTTGVPKGVVQTHRQERAMIRNLLFETIRPGADATFVAATPLAHAAGAFVMPTVLGGGSVSWLSRFDADRLVNAGWLGGASPPQAIETFVVPTALADLARAATGGHALRTVVYGGAPCPDPVLDLALTHLGADRLVQVYGQAEAPVTICIASRSDHARDAVRNGWVGYPYTFVEVEIEGTGDAGEVLVRAEHVMSGYWGRPEESAARLTPDGALRTGDLGVLDETGGLRIVGRAREIVISGGFNVYPDDVERRLEAGGLAGVPIAAFGVAHPRWGEALVLAVTRTGESDAATLDRAKAVAEATLAYYERPKEIFVVDALPLTPVGKVARQDLSARFGTYFTERRSA